MPHLAPALKTRPAVLPNDEAGVAPAIATVLDDEGPRRRMRDAGLRRAAKFS